MPNFPLGHHAHLQRQANAKRIAQLTPSQPAIHVHTGFSFPDPQDLRGIPALAQGVGGTIPGTQPEQHACR
jgi:hypothetical protein